MVWRVTRNELLQQLAEHLMQLEHHSSRSDNRRNASRGRTRAPPGRPAAVPRREVDHAPLHAVRVGEAPNPGPPGYGETAQLERKSAD
eukprot:12920748-Prorocentrum_lima.AAC.1